MKDYRIAAELRQEDVAEKLDVAQAAISNWELGKYRPVRKYRAKLAKLYDVPEDELFKEEPALEKEGGE